MQSSPDSISRLDCIICYKPYNKTVNFPRVLPCGHTFCQLCLVQLISYKKIFKCSLCNTQFNDFSLGRAYKNLIILQIVEQSKMTSQVQKQVVIEKSTFEEIVQEMDRCNKSVRRLVIRRLRDDEGNPFDFDLVRNNKNSMRFYSMLPIFQRLVQFQFYVRFSAHGFEQCLADSLNEIKTLKQLTIYNQYDQFNKLNDIVSLLKIDNLQCNIIIGKWA